MGNRFGRNKRRAARDRIAELEREVLRLTASEKIDRSNLLRALAAADTARTDALRQFMASGGFYKHVLEQMARAAGYAAGKEFASSAKRSTPRARAAATTAPLCARSSPCAERTRTRWPSKRRSLTSTSPPSAWPDQILGDWF